MGIYEVTCRTKFAHDVVTGAYGKAEAIIVSTAREADDRAAAIISESTAKARLEADRILARAKEQGHSIIAEETNKAQQYGLLIIVIRQERRPSQYLNKLMP